MEALRSILRHSGGTSGTVMTAKMNVIIVVTHTSQLESEKNVYVFGKKRN